VLLPPQRVRGSQLPIAKPLLVVEIPRALVAWPVSEPSSSSSSQATGRRSAMSPGDKKRTACVTGGNGYIASALLKMLLEKGYAVKTTVRNPGSILPSFTSVQCSERIYFHKSVRWFSFPAPECYAKLRHQRFRYHRFKLLVQWSYTGVMHDHKELAVIG